METLKRPISALLALVMVLTMLPAPNVSAAEEVQDVTAPVQTLPDLEFLQISEETTTVETEASLETTAAMETVVETTMPEETVAETTLPEETVAETTLPEETVAETTLPEETVAETTLPEETVAETTMPAETVPESTEEESEVTEPEDAVEEEIETNPLCGDNVNWEINQATGTLRIWGEGAMYGYSFLEDAPWYEYKQDFHTVVVEEGVTSIGSYAFEMCSNLTSAFLPKSLIWIGQRAFEDCSKLKEIIIPESVSSIGSSAFANCNALTSVIIPEGITNWGSNIFYNCSKLNTAILPENMSRIPWGLFAGCESLNTIVIPESVTAIEEDAFSGCLSLTDVVIPENVNSISSSAFNKCTKLDTVVFQCDSCEIDTDAFRGVAADVYCPASWTEDMMQNYGGELTWHVISALSFVLQPEDCVSAVGAEAVFAARASEDACYQWSWSADGKNWTPIEGANGMELVLTVEAQHNGQLFRCEATNAEGATVISAAASLSLYSQLEADMSFDVKIEKGGDIAYFAFIPEHTDYYTFRTNYKENITLDIRDCNNKILAADSGKSDWSNGVSLYHTAEVVIKLEAGQTYILSAKYGRKNITGNFRAELKTSHDDSNAVITPATCVEDGNKVFVCTFCGQKITKVLPATGHTMDEGKVVEEPNCYKEGIIVYVCTMCKEEITERIPIQHTYEDMDEICDICGYTYNYMPELELGPNSWGGLWYWYIPQYTHCYTLSSSSPAVRCGVYDECDNLLFEAESDGTGFELDCILEAGSKYIVKLAPLYDGIWDYSADIQFEMKHNYETLMPESCADGKIIRTCTDCGDRITEEMEHSWNDGDILIEATCVSDGFTSYRCTVCGKQKTERITGSHSWDNGIVTEASCEADGQIVYQCTVCQEQHVEVLTGGHNYASYGDNIGICTVCGTARHAEGTCGELKWVLQGRKLTISGNGAIPDYTGYPNYAPWYEYCEEILEIEITDGVKRLGNYAFYGCEATTVRLPDSLEEIGDNVFQYTTISRLDIPAKVHTIGENVFTSCENLTGIWVHSENPHFANDMTGTLYSKDMTTLIAVSAAVSGNFTIPDTVEVLCSGAFYTKHNAIGSIIFHKNIRKIPSKLLDSFNYTLMLQFTGTAPEFAEDAFENFYGTVFYPDGDTTWVSVIQNSYGGDPEWIAYHAELLGSGVFGNALHWELAPDGVLSISGNGAMPNFGYDSATGEDLLPPWETYKNLITKVVIEKGVTTIGNHVFTEHGSIVSVDIPDGVTYIGHSAFDGCLSLKTVSIPEGVTEFGWNIFLDCRNLVSATLPEGMTVIPDTMFGRCYSLTEVNIPSTVTSIEAYAFSNCHSLETVNLPKKLTYLGDKAFRGTGIRSIVVPDKVSAIGADAFANCTELTSVQLPRTLQSIGACAFAYCPKLPDIDIPDTVKYIGWGAFMDCTSLTDVTIPDGISYLGGTFFGCSSLKNVNIPDSVKTLAYFAFYNCSSLTVLDMPEKLESIEFEVFLGSGIQEVTLPQTVSSLDHSVFKDSALEKITFTGDAPEMVLYKQYTNNSATGTFVGVEADAYYPESNTTWTKKILSANYGGNINWIPYKDDGPVGGMCGEHLTWTFDPETGTLIIAGYGDMYDYRLEDPAPWAPWREDIRKIILPDTITSIGDYAFHGCDKVERIVISKTIKAIGVNAFRDCAGMKEITFQGDAPVVASDAFTNVTATLLYPVGNSTWNAAVMQNYGGNLTWKPDGESEFTLGDVNQDDKINAMDATRILRYAAKLITEDKVDLNAADVNGDGRVNAMDATRILRYVAKLIPTLRVEK